MKLRHCATLIAFAGLCLAPALHAQEAGRTRFMPLSPLDVRILGLDLLVAEVDEQHVAAPDSFQAGLTTPPLAPRLAKVGPPGLGLGSKSPLVDAPLPDRGSPTIPRSHSSDWAMPAYMGDNITVSGPRVALAPVPEPSSWLLMLAGLATVGIAMRVKMNGG